ncbi:hypothetical protein ACFXB3_07290 [Streptomyces sp. NPDC059447]|uniref:hypothetical protein n=1 Tax=Streptomyces sp. NPDC059447 TaxID=3346834 RepID=UPI0036B865FB
MSYSDAPKRITDANGEVWYLKQPDNGGDDIPRYWTHSSTYLPTEQELRALRKGYKFRF